MAPQFWYRPPNSVLRLVGRLARGTLRHQETPVSIDAPVIRVGSLSLGGTGKTPTVIAIAQRLILKGRNVHVVTRGAGVPFQVDERVHRAADVGDEPLLIAAFAPTWVAHDSVEGARAAVAAGAEVVVLDDNDPVGPIAADAVILAEDAVRGFGNGLAWPLGPLKLPLSEGLRGVDLVVAIGPAKAQTAFRARWERRLLCPVIAGHLAPLPTGMDWEGLDVVAFAGIGAPERFFATLNDLGANVHKAQALSDHQELTPALLARLEKEAKARGAQLVTTEKDAVRLPRSFRQKVVSLPVRLNLDDWSALDVLLP